MPDTYTLLEKVVVGAATASSVSFTSIPQTYTDLCVVMSTRHGRAVNSSSLRLRINSDTGANYSNLMLQGDGTNITNIKNSGSTSIIYFYGDGSTATANTFSNVQLYFANYSGSNYKSISIDSTAENNGGLAPVNINSGLWSSTSAITSLTFDEPNGPSNFLQHSTFYLYGVAKFGVTPTSAPKATGGDRIVTDGTYWYHAFTSSSTFTPKQSLSCDVLVVAGGGSGGWPYSGGGGAGE